MQARSFRRLILLDSSSRRRYHQESDHSRVDQRLLTTAANVVCWTNDLMTLEKNSPTMTCTISFRWCLGRNFRSH